MFPPVRTVSAAASLLVALAAPGCSRRPAVATAQLPFPGVRNVLLLVVDTLRADHLGCYGYPRRTSDTIDAVAQQGVRFEQCYCAWPETCESMAAMLSGLYCQTTGVVVDTPQPIPTDLEMLPETLKRAGLQTVAFVNNPVLAAANHYDQGFEGDYHDVSDRRTNPDYRTETSLAREWLRSHAAKGPFFAWVHYIEPHSPYEPRQPLRFVNDRSYDPSRKVVVRTEQEKWNAVGGFPGFSRLEGHDELAWYVAQYDSEIADVDEKIAALFETLAEERLDDSTLVIVTADHGEGFGEHDYYYHGQAPFDETAHVPLIFRLPGSARGVAKELVSTIDLAPTILEILGFPIPPRYEGRSLVAQLKNPGITSDRLVFTESGKSHGDRDWQRSVRDREWKLVWMPGEYERGLFQLDPLNLFDVAHDPGETRNLFDERPEVAARLKHELDAWVRADSLFHADPVTLDPAAQEKIKSMGYATGDSGGEPRRAGN